jgi:hypothetical protein
VNVREILFSCSLRTDGQTECIAFRPVLYESAMLLLPFTMVAVIGRVVSWHAVYFFIGLCLGTGFSVSCSAHSV